MDPVVPDCFKSGDATDDGASNDGLVFVDLGVGPDLCVVVFASGNLKLLLQDFFAFHHLKRTKKTN